MLSLPIVGRIGLDTPVVGYAAGPVLDDVGNAPAAGLCDAAATVADTRDAAAAAADEAGCALVAGSAWRRAGPAVGAVAETCPTGAAASGAEVGGGERVTGANALMPPFCSAAATALEISDAAAEAAEGPATPMPAGTAFAAPERVESSGGCGCGC